MQYEPKKQEVPIWQKKMLDTKEAVAYFGIGRNKLYEICEKRGTNFIVKYDGRRFFRREKLEAYLNKQYSI